jgi:hypothetical protein
LIAETGESARRRKAASENRCQSCVSGLSRSKRGPKCPVKHCFVKKNPPARCKRWQIALKHRPRVKFRVPSRRFARANVSRNGQFASKNHSGLRHKMSLSFFGIPSLDAHLTCERAWCFTENVHARRGRLGWTRHCFVRLKPRYPRA